MGYMATQQLTTWRKQGENDGATCYYDVTDCCYSVCAMQCCN